MAIKSFSKIDYSIPPLNEFMNDFGYGQEVKCSGKFKVSDYAWVSANGANGSDLCVGDKVEIVEIGFEGYEVKDEQGETWHIHECNLLSKSGIKKRGPLRRRPHLHW